MAEEGGGWVAGGKGGVSLCVCVWERVEAVCVCGGGCRVCVLRVAAVFACDYPL